jgi:NDP-sugar pyrophosphorylase family protein
LKAVILVGGEGTRLRPLTLSLPKPVVPVVDRPFLRHQLDLLARVGVREVVFSVAYRPEKIQAVFGDGSAFGFTLRYAVEDTPLGTGGAVRNALSHLDERTIVFNGDVLTDVDLPKVLEDHERTKAAATIVLTPVPNPSAYGLVETDATGRVLRFLEKPDPSQITTDTINAGIYVLETRLLDLIPGGQVHSIERGFFPALLQRGDLFRAHVHRGYWIDIGTPEKYRQVHQDILAGRFPVDLQGAKGAQGWVHPEAQVSPAARVAGPVYVGPGCRVEADAILGPGTVLVRDAVVEAKARVEQSILWPGARIEAEARLHDCVLGPGVRIGRSATLRSATLGEGTVLSDFSRLEGASTA